MKNNYIYPCIWSDGQAKEAAAFYCETFANSAITVDTPMVVNYQLSGQKFMGLNGGPQFKSNPSISFFVVCETETETDQVWSRLSEGGAVIMALDKYDWSEKYGWIQDRFGLSWQVSFGKLSDVGQKFTPTLMFAGKQNGRAEEAIHYYTSVFKNSAIAGILKYKEGEDEPAGSVKHAQFNLDGYVMMAMDSSLPHSFGFNEAISFVVECENQEEIDYFWNKLTDGGEESRCGWLKDRFGVSWQVIPRVLSKLMTDPGKRDRVFKALLQMKKFVIQELLDA